MIAISGLTKNYGGITAVHSINLTILAGEIFGLLGPNGAGKTTLIRMLTMLTRPTRGKIEIDGYEMSRDLTVVKKIIGVVPQNMNLDLELTARENLELHGRLHGLTRAKRRERIEELLGFVGLVDKANFRVSGFSGGMKRRLMIARALMHYPKVLLLDEPTVGLDPQTRRKIWDMIKKMNTAGMTVLLTTHYIEEAESICHRVGIIDSGNLIAVSNPGDLVAKIGEMVVESFYGEESEYKFFLDRKSALIYAESIRGRVLVRETNLEDVFIELTGRKVEN